MKEKHNKKMRKSNYHELKLQPYLTSRESTVEEKKMILRWIISMEKFGDNYKAGRETVLCPLCMKHKDDEEESFKYCKVVEERFGVSGCFESIFDDNISRETINYMKKIMELRGSNTDKEENNKEEDE